MIHEFTPCICVVNFTSMTLIKISSLPSFTLVKARAVIWKCAVLANPKTVGFAGSSAGYEDLRMFVAYDLEPRPRRADD